MNELTKEIDAQRGKPGETFKTDHFTDDQDAKLKRNAKSQEARILKFLELHSNGVGASAVWQALRNSEPLTSFRRALNSLAKQGKVEMLAEKRVGYYGAPEHLWRLKRD
jgi:Fe2+ or Zn2+ uptake regulation protein